MNFNRRFGVYIEFKANFTPVNFLLYIAFDYAHCFDIIDEHKQTRKRKYFVKQLGNRHRFYQFDERFAAALNELDEVHADEFYEEPTSDDLASVQIHQPDKKNKLVKVVWRGLARGRATPELSDETPEQALGFLFIEATLKERITGLHLSEGE